jgi:RNA polymerase-associated protein CTR9
MNALAGH